MRIGFEVLHYKTINDTVACVKSILNFVENSVIVIVDNYSNDGSGERLKEIFNDNENVNVIQCDSNLGFARGNNIGYSFLKKLGNVDYICCINNDTLITSSDFEKKLRSEFEKASFDILAPKALLKDNSIQSFNPTFRDKHYYEEELKKWLDNVNYSNYLKCLDKVTILFLKYPRLMGLVRKIKQKVSCPYDHRIEDCVLHGCFLVFSMNFIEKNENAFDERTFMYREEELLYLKVRKNNLKTVYCPEIVIRHNEDSSTNSIYKKKEDKYQFMRRNQIKSLKILIQEMENV